MRKLLFLLTLLSTFIFAIACGPQDGGAMDEESAETTSQVSGTEVDVQLGLADEPTDTSSHSETDTSIIAEPVQPEPVSADIVPPSEALIAQLPGYDPGDIQETASGLQYIIYEAGSGDTPANGDTVITHYTGYLPDGSKFDSSRDKNSTFNFPVGQGRVIRGWDEGFALMNPGTKALLIIPATLGYGATGSGEAIPPNSTLYFDVELVDIEEVQPPRQPIEVATTDFTDLADGLRYHDFTIGDGANAESGKVVSLDFAVWDMTTGELLGDSATGGQPLNFKLGSEQMFIALQDGIAGMQVGGSRQIFMPSTILEGAGLPPNADIIFEVELLDVLDGSPEFPSEVADSDFIELESGVRYADIIVGEGALLVEGDFASLHYTAWLDDGTAFDSTVDRGAPFEFAYGAAQIPGFNEALVDITRGTTRQIIIPADIIGDLGLGEPRDVIFDIEILSEQ